MPKGVPVNTFAIGEAGAGNAALAAIAMLATTDDAIAEKLEAFRVKQNTGCARYAFAFVNWIFARLRSVKIGLGVSPS